MNKRDFMLAGGSVLVGSSAMAALLPGTGPLQSQAAAHGLTAWQQRIGERFEVLGQPVATNLLLDGVAVHEHGVGTEQFTLQFSGSVALPPGSRLLRGGDGQVVVLYLDSAGRTGEGAPMVRADCALLT